MGSAIEQTESGIAQSKHIPPDNHDRLALLKDASSQQNPRHAKTTESARTSPDIATQDAVTNFDGSKRTPLDRLIDSVPPSAQQCRNFKKLLNDFDPKKPLVDALEKGNLIDPMLADKSLMAYAGLDPMAEIPGAYFRRPAAEPGKGSTEVMPASKFAPQMKSIFGGADTAIVRNHVAVNDLKIPDIMAQHGVTRETPVTLINLDAHSDIYSKDGAYGKGTANIGNWVNTMLADNPNIKDFYWIMPSDFIDKPEYSYYYASGKNHDHILADSTNERKLFVDNKTQDFSFDKIPAGQSADDFREIAIHRRTLKNMDDLSSKNVIFSTDSDFFANRGYDTGLKAQTDWRGDAGFKDYFHTLQDKHIKPFLSLISASPEYVKPEAMPQLEKFDFALVQNSLHGRDLLATPASNYVNPKYMSPDLHHHGIVTFRDTPNLELLTKLHEGDQSTKTPDGAVSLKRSKANTELELAIKNTAELYNTTDDKAFDLLKRFGDKWRMDPKQPKDVLNFGWIEEMLTHTCQDGQPLPKKS